MLVRMLVIMIVLMLVLMLVLMPVDYAQSCDYEHAYCDQHAEYHAY